MGVIHGLDELYSNPLTEGLANLAYGASKVVLGGGPLKTVAYQLGKVAVSSSIDQGVAYVSGQAQTAATGYVSDLAARNGLSIDVTFAGQTHVLGAEQFGDVAGLLVGSVVNTVLGGAITGVTERAGQVSNVVARGSNNVNTRQSATIGQEAHRQIQADRIGEYVPEQRISLPNGQVVRKDGVGVDDPTKVLIIKPDTPTGNSAAQRRADLMRSYGYDPEVQLYDPTDPRYLPGSSTYIGPK